MTGDRRKERQVRVYLNGPMRTPTATSRRFTRPPPPSRQRPGSGEPGWIGVSTSNDPNFYNDCMRAPTENRDGLRSHCADARMGSAGPTWSCSRRTAWCMRCAVRMSCWTG